MTRHRLIFIYFLLQNLHLISASPWPKEDNYLYDYIAAFPYMSAMQDVVWFISQQLTSEQIARTDNLVKNISQITKIPQFIWTEMSDVRMIKIQSKRGYIGMLLTTGPEDPIMLVHYTILIKRHYNLMFVVYMGKVGGNMNAINDISYMLYQGKFVNSMIYYKTDEGQPLVYCIEMYPEFKMINSSDYVWAYNEMKKRISSASQNVQGYIFYTPLKQDIPNVFKSRNIKGAEKIEGISYSLLNNFINSIHGYVEDYDLICNKTEKSDIVNMQEILDLLRYKHIDITVHAYALFQPDDAVDKSFPLKVVKWCLMLPIRNRISTFFYTLQPFEARIWCLVLLALAAMCLKDFIDNICQCLKESNFKLFLVVINKSCLNNFCHNLNISPAHSINKRFLYYTLIFSYGFFLSSFYTSYLGSSLTVSLFRDQINNLQDLIKHNQSVMVIDYEWQFLLNEGYEPLPEFQNLVYPVNSTTFYKHQIQFNSSYAYFITDDRWDFLHEQQKHLKQKHFKFSDICFGSYHLAYPMQTDLPIWRDLEYFILNLHASGLFQKYERKALYFAFKGDNLKHLKMPKVYTAAGWEHLQVIFYFLGCMHVISLVFFIGEILYYKHEV